MKKLTHEKVFVQYRDTMTPYQPIINRHYTITHDDETAELFVFVSQNYANDQVTEMYDDVKISWQHQDYSLALIGSVIVDSKDIKGDSATRNRIFYEEMPTALQALRHADRFLFAKSPRLDNAPIIIHFISDNPTYNKTYHFGIIGDYK